MTRVTRAGEVLIVTGNKWLCTKSVIRVRTHIQKYVKTLKKSIND